MANDEIRIDLEHFDHMPVQDDDIYLNVLCLNVQETDFSYSLTLSEEEEKCLESCEPDHECVKGVCLPNEIEQFERLGVETIDQNSDISFDLRSISQKFFIINPNGKFGSLIFDDVTSPLTIFFYEITTKDNRQGLGRKVYQISGSPSHENSRIVTSIYKQVIIQIVNPTVNDHKVTIRFVKFELNFSIMRFILIMLIGCIVLTLILVLIAHWFKRCFERQMMPDPSRNLNNFNDLIPEIEYSAELHENVTECSICLQDFQAKEKVIRILACEHIFHRGCLQDWLFRKQFCPLCKLDLSIVSLREETEIRRLMRSADSSLAGIVSS